MAGQRLRSIVVDCERPAALARFWAPTLGYTVREYSQADRAWLAERGLTPETDPTVAIDPPVPGPNIWFVRVPEGKTVKNRVHIDVNLDSAGEIDDVIARGARILREPLPDERWYIMADPEGNEFCAFPPEG